MKSFGSQQIYFYRIGVGILSERIRVPRYIDDEVRVFHPYFETAMAKALHDAGIEKEIELVHHWSKRGFSGIIDFVLLNPSSNKILLAMELKKTPTDLVRQGRRQARNYLENLGTSRGSDFYLASNLEKVELFKHTMERPITSSQLVKTNYSHVGSLDSSNAEVFYENLVKALTEVLELIEGNDGTLFASNVIGLLNALEVNVQNEEKWRYAITSYLHDFARGALNIQTGVEFTDKLANQENDIRTSDITNGLLKIGIPIHLNDINSELFNQRELSEIVAGAFEAGKADPKCDELSSIINEFGTNVLQIPGAIETDLVLAKLLFIHTIPDGYKPNSKVLDPGSGSGNLLFAALEMNKDIKAQSIVAVESSYIYIDVLKTKLNLHFANSFSSDNHPLVLHTSIEDAPQKVFSEAQIILMNPPFIRGIDAVTQKNRLRILLKELHNVDSILTEQQLGYECGLLEFITFSTSKGSEFGTIFTKNSLTRSDSASFRRFLINEFGLHTVVSYPTKDLFNGAQKETVILAGKIGTKGHDVKFIQFQEGLEKLSFETVDNYEKFANLNSQHFQSNTYSSESLLADATEGWKKYLIGDDLEISKLFESCSLPFEVISENHTIFRGSIGNIGASDLLFNPRKSVIETSNEMPLKWISLEERDLEVAAKNSDVVPRILNRNQGETGFYVEEIENKQLAKEKKIKLATDYVAGKVHASNSGTQRRRSLSISDVQDILNSSKPVSGNLVLVPRAQRVKAQISISLNHNIMISTNFLVIETSSPKEARLLGSWLLSIFGQIQQEALGINQEGMRKIEKAQLQMLLVPDFKSLSPTDEDELLANFDTEDAMNLGQPCIRRIDEIWARILVPEDFEIYLQTIFIKFASLCSNR